MEASLALRVMNAHLGGDGTAGFVIGTYPRDLKHSIGSWLCSDRGSFNSGAHLNFRFMGIRTPPRVCGPSLQSVKEIAPVERFLALK
jgi:hypothetical protein